MSGLSWGRRSVVAPRPRWRLVAIGALLLAAIVTIVWWRNAQEEPPPNAITPTLQNELQALLDIHVERLALGDEAGVLLTVDGTRADLVRCAKRAVAAGRTMPPPRVESIERYGNVYIAARVREADGEALYWFRRAGVFWNRAAPPFYIWGEAWRWYLSRPTAEELAARPGPDGRAPAFVRECG